MKHYATTPTSHQCGVCQQSYKADFSGGCFVCDACIKEGELTGVYHLELGNDRVLSPAYQWFSRVFNY